MKEAVKIEIRKAVDKVIENAQEELRKEALSCVDKIALRVAENYEVTSMLDRIVITVLKPKN